MLLVDETGTVRAVNGLLAELLGERHVPAIGEPLSASLRRWAAVRGSGVPELPEHWPVDDSGREVPAAVLPHPLDPELLLQLEVGPPVDGRWMVVLRPLPANGRLPGLMVRSIREAAFALDAAGRVLSWNEPAVLLLGHGAADSMYASRIDDLLTLFRHGDASALRSIVSRALADGRDRHLTDGLELQTPQGILIPVELLLSVPGPGAERLPADGLLPGLPYAMLRLRNMSEERQAWQDVGEIHHAREISRAAVGIAHELNNGATTLMTALERLAEIAGSGQTSVRNELLAADAAVRRIRRLGLQLERFTGLEISPPEGAGGRPEECPPEVLQETVLDSVALAVSGSGMRSSFHIEDPLPVVAIAPSALSQAIFNVVTNAVEAMDAEGVVHIDIRHDREGELVSVEVRDDGHGMNPRLVQRVLEPYFSTRPGGIGMGLTVTLSLIEARGGNLEIDTDPGFGTTVRMRIPTAGRSGGRRGALDRGSPASGAPINLKQLRVLLVEDDPLVRRSIERALSNAGVSVVSAENGDRAIELYRQSLEEDASFGLLLTDFSMPGRTDGVQLLRRVRELTPGLPAVLSSGALHLQSATSYREAGFQYVLRKPFGEDELRHALRVALRGA